MHKIAFLFLLSLFSINSFSQTDIVIPKMSNIIELNTDYTTIDEAMKHISSTLLSNGIGILNTNEKLGYFNTNVYSNRQVSNQLTLSFRLEEEKVVVNLFGTFLSGLEISLWGVTTSDKWQTIVYRGQRGSLFRQAWDGMMKVAEMIEYTKINFKGATVKPTPETDQTKGRLTDPLYQ